MILEKILQPVTNELHLLSGEFADFGLDFFDFAHGFIIRNSRERSSSWLRRPFGNCAFELTPTLGFPSAFSPPRATATWQRPPLAPNRL
jgi:hypothetical protein